MAQDPNKFYYEDKDGKVTELRQQSKEQAKARYKASRVVQDKKRATMREYKAAEKGKTLEQKMRETGRSEKFIQKHKNDTPAMQAKHNAAQRKAAGLKGGAASYVSELYRETGNKK